MIVATTLWYSSKTFGIAVTLETFLADKISNLS